MTLFACPQVIRLRTSRSRGVQRVQFPKDRIDPPAYRTTVAVEKSSARWMLSVRSEFDNGYRRKLKAPQRMASTADCTSLQPVMKMIGVVAPRSFQFNAAS